MSWSKVILIVLALVVMAIAIYFLLKLLGIDITEIFIPTKPYQELTSMAALACAIDVVGTQDIDVTTCNDKFYRWGEANVFETITGYSILAKNIITGRISLNSAPKDWDVFCSTNPAFFTSPTRVGFVCESRRGDKSFVECERCEEYECLEYPRKEECERYGKYYTNYPVEVCSSTCIKHGECIKPAEKWKCRVKNFLLEQKIITTGIDKWVKEMVEKVPSLGNYLAGLAGGAVTQFGAIYTGFFGMPKYVMYYETFPQGAEESWQYTTVDAILVGVAIGGATNVIGEAATALGSAVKHGALVLLKRESNEMAIGAIKNAILKKAVKEEIAERGAKEAIKKLIKGSTARQVISSEAEKELYERIAAQGSKKLAEEGYEVLVEGSPKLGKPGLLQIMKSYSKAYGKDARFAEAWHKNFVMNLNEYAKKGIEITDDTVSELLESSIPVAMTEKEKKGFALMIKEGFFSNTHKSLTKVVGEVVEKGILEKPLLKEISEETLEKIEERIAATSVKTLLEAYKLYGMEGYLIKSGNLFEKPARKFWQEVSEYARAGTESMQKLVEMIERETGEKGVGEKISKAIEKKIEQEIAKAGKEEVKATLKASSKFWREKAESFIKGWTGLPPELSRGKLMRRVGLISALAAGSYVYNILKERAEVYGTCGGNSLCLHTSKLMFSQNNYNISLSKPSEIFVISNIATLIGKDPWRAWAVSPCSADIEVSLGEVNCEETMEAKKLYYRVHRTRCIRETATGAYSIVEEADYDECRKEKSLYKFKDELISTYDVDKAYCERNFLTKSSDTELEEEFVDYPLCVRKDFEDRANKNAELKNKIIMKEVGEDIYYYDLRFELLNLKENVFGGYTTISKCERGWLTDVKGWFGGTQKMKAVYLDYYKGTQPIDYNYCVVNKAKMSNLLQAACVGGLGVGLSIGVSILTSGVGSLAAQFILGSTAAACEGLLGLQDKWPHTQLS